MRLPRFSTRALLMMVAICAVIALLLSWAMRGGILGDLGIVAAAAAAMAGAIVAVQVLMVAVCRLVGVVAGRRKRNRLEAPSAGGTVTVVALLIVTMAFGQEAIGQPTFTQLGFSGGSLQVWPPETPFHQGEGYTPVRFTLAPTAALGADRELTVELRPSYGLRGEVGLRVTKPITIPAGSLGKVETTLLWPPSAWNGPLWFEVFEAGRPIQGLAGVINANVGGWFPGSRPPTIAIVGGAALSLAAQANVTRRWQNVWQTQGMPGAVGPIFLPAPVPNLPENWLEYSNVDLLCMAMADARTLAQGEPKRWRAIQDWTLAGGNLFIFGLDRQWKDLSELNGLLGLAAESQSVAAWKAMPDTIPVDQNSFDSAPDADEPELEPPPKKRGQSSGLEGFRAPREYGMGQVLVSNLATVADVGTELWRRITPQIGMDRLYWSARHGLTMFAKNDDFYEFLVPGVGLAPVTEFSILITLFAVIVGPVNFYLLRQRKRLYLLLITVPLAAAVVTAGLLAYAAIGEGLGVRVRARSVTHLDQKSGEAATWARLSYYAGVGPSDGLRFSSDTAVLPIHAYRQEETDGRRTVHWSEVQHLATGWLPARSPTQFLSIRPHRTTARLNVVVSEGKPIRVENALGAKISHLAVFDDAGKAYIAQNISLGGSSDLAADGDLTPIGLALFDGQASKRMPEGLGDYQTSRGLFEMRSRGDWNYYGPGRFGRGTAVNGDASRLERVLATLGGSRNAILDARNHQPRTYVAIVESSPAVEFGLKSVDEEASFHVILGKW
jgi:hypothetical protein